MNPLGLAQSTELDLLHGGARTALDTAEQWSTVRKEPANPRRVVEGLGSASSLETLGWSPEGQFSCCWHLIQEAQMCKVLVKSSQLIVI